MSTKTGRPAKSEVTWAALYEANILYQLQWSMDAIAARVGLSRYQLYTHLDALIHGPGDPPLDPIPTCKHGHEMVGENIVRIKSRPTLKICRECRRRNGRDYWRRHHART